MSIYGERLHIGMKERMVADKILAALKAHSVKVEGYREIVLLSKMCLWNW